MKFSNELSVQLVKNDTSDVIESLPLKGGEFAIDEDGFDRDNDYWCAASADVEFFYEDDKLGEIEISATFKASYSEGHDDLSLSFSLTAIVSSTGNAYSGLSIDYDGGIDPLVETIERD